MELQEALRQISTIRDAAAKTEIFRGYSAATTGFSAVLGIAAAKLQSALLPRPWEQFDPFLYLWCSVAITSVAVVGVELWRRTRRLESPLAMRQTWLAVEQFLPCLVAGGLVTVVIAQNPDVGWMLPGLWATFFSLGMFASLKFLPRAMVLVAFHYLISGILCLCLAKEDATLSPWAMGLTFGLGQSMAAAILYWNLERHHAEA